MTCRTCASSGSWDNLVARTELGRPQRLLLAGHTDTVPPHGNERPRLDGDVLWGLGAADMKGGLAVFLSLVESYAEPAVDLTLVLYAREEIRAVGERTARARRGAPRPAARRRRGAGRADRGRHRGGMPGHHAPRGPPGRGPGPLRATVAGPQRHPPGGAPADGAGGPTSRGVPCSPDASSARPLQAVTVEGGVAGNVVPDAVTVTINHRFAPDRSTAEAEDHVREVLAPHLEDVDEVHLVDVADAAPPGVGPSAPGPPGRGPGARGAGEARLDRRGAAGGPWACRRSTSARGMPRWLTLRTSA